MGPLDLTVEDIAFQPAQPAFDQERWTEHRAEERGAGGRQVLGIALSLAAALWLAFTAWSAGRVLVGQPLSSPAVAQWVAIAAGPLALLGLAWLMFGRTRRREAEKFTRSVIAMRSEARSLEALLEVLAQRIGDSHQALGTVAERLMSLGDEATGRLGGVTREFDSSSERLVRHGQALDQAAEAAEPTSRCFSTTSPAPKPRHEPSPNSCAPSAASRRPKPRIWASRSQSSRNAPARPTG